MPQISEGRKLAYYLGLVLMLAGLALFVSVFFTGGSRIGDPANFASGMQSDMTRGLIGMGLLLVGGIVRGVGARGIAGSGVVLDPKRARRDLEPYSRMAGGMVKDALDEADIRLGAGTGGNAQKVVMVKCRACGKLNEEDSKFCQECGKPI